MGAGHHIYLNPYDESLTYYYATSIVNKYVYKNLSSLLFCKSKNMYDNYKKLLTETNQRNEAFQLTNLIIDQTIVKKPTREDSTLMYKDSNLVYNFQYINRYKILRHWSDDILAEIIKMQGSNLIESRVSKSVFSLISE